MDGENHGKTLIKWMIWGENPPFKETPISLWSNINTYSCWLNQPLLKKMRKSKLVHLPQFSGLKFQKSLSCHHPVISFKAKTFFSDIFLVLWLIMFFQKIWNIKKNGFVQNVLMILLPQQCCQKVCGMLVGIIIHPRIAFCSESQTRRDCNDQTSAKSKSPLGRGHQVIETGSGGGRADNLGWYPLSAGGDFFDQP